MADGESGEYLAVHRVCVRKIQAAGTYGKIIIAFAASLRSCGRKSSCADTHRDNLAMRAALKRTVLSSGVIYPAYGGERIAYEK
ncbi:MAG: hypothetical protein ACLS4Z_07115 [Christensenellaceae bacterium]